jgi:hypothetical protein
MAGGFQPREIMYRLNSCYDSTAGPVELGNLLDEASLKAAE